MLSFKIFDTVEKCFDYFFDDMTTFFSQFEECYLPEKLDIETIKLNKYKNITTDLVGDVIYYHENEPTNEYKPITLENKDINCKLLKIINYGTSGGLRIGFNGLIFEIMSKEELYLEKLPIELSISKGVNDEDCSDDDHRDFKAPCINEDNYDELYLKRYF